MTRVTASWALASQDRPETALPDPRPRARGLLDTRTGGGKNSRPPAEAWAETGGQAQGRGGGFWFAKPGRLSDLLPGRGGDHAPQEPSSQAKGFPRRVAQRRVPCALQTRPGRGCGCAQGTPVCGGLSCMRCLPCTGLPGRWLHPPPVHTPPPWPSAPCWPGLRAPTPWHPEPQQRHHLALVVDMLVLVDLALHV